MYNNNIEQSANTLEEVLETLPSTTHTNETIQSTTGVGNIETGKTPASGVHTEEDPLVEGQNSNPWVLEVDEDKPKDVKWTGSGYTPTIDEDGNRTSGDNAAEIVVKKRNGELPL